MRLEIVAFVLGLLRAVAYPLARRHYKQRHVVALPALRWQHIVAQAQIVALPLSRKSKRVQRLLAARREEMQGLPRRLCLEELPHRANLHEFRGFLLHFFHALKQFHGLWASLFEAFLEVAAESHVPAIQHERIDVTPDPS